MKTEFSNIICVADVNVTELMEKALGELALPEVFVQQAKQMFLTDKRGLFGLRSRTKLEESRAVVYRFNVPLKFGQGVMRHIVNATDLRMGGRGCIYSHPTTLYRGTSLKYDEERLESICGTDKAQIMEDYALICCTVTRGLGDTLSQAVLELGVCVPIVFFGSGVGLRDRLGLLRITVPVEKEVLWFLVPRSDAELVEKTLIPRARLDVPGHGFIYKRYVHAPVVNLRVRHGKRVHAASMEQVIAALDEVRGSSDWRRLGSRKIESLLKGANNTNAMKGLFFIGEEEEADLFRRTAMDNGARGATLNVLEMRSYRAHEQGQSAEEAMESLSREFCDIIIPLNLEETIISKIEKTGLFEAGKSCMLKVIPAERPVSFSHLRSGSGA
ncbi:hypothetical protein AGMMS49928_24100 [Spirochaetia bacterium]|nr:hypothetical protein AGMMS49928_24100 [Spirochaetia bacterium]